MLKRQCMYSEILKNSGKQIRFFTGENVIESASRAHRYSEPGNAAKDVKPTAVSEMNTAEYTR